MIKTNKIRHSAFNCETFVWKKKNILCRQRAMDSERVALKIVAFLLVITAIRKAQRFRFSVLNMYFLLKRRRHDLITALLTRKIRRQRQASARRRRAVWVYPKPQGWFEEIYQNPVLSASWKNDFRVSKETFDYIWQLIQIRKLRHDFCAFWVFQCRQLFAVDFVYFGF